MKGSAIVNGSRCVFTEYMCHIVPARNYSLARNITIYKDHKWWDVHLLLQYRKIPMTHLLYRKKIRRMRPQLVFIHKKARGLSERNLASFRLPSWRYMDNIEGDKFTESMRFDMDFTNVNTPSSFNRPQETKYSDKNYSDQTICVMVTSNLFIKTTHCQCKYIWLVISDWLL